MNRSYTRLKKEKKEFFFRLFMVIVETVFSNVLGFFQSVCLDVTFQLVQL